MLIQHQPTARSSRVVAIEPQHILQRFLSSLITLLGLPEAGFHNVPGAGRHLILLNYNSHQTFVAVG